MCATGECHDCSILADLDEPVTCLHCGYRGHTPLVRHRGELVHAECVEAFEVMTDNAAAGGVR
jgi:hypothetical protein